MAKEEDKIKRDETRPNYVEKNNFVDRDKIVGELAREMGLGEEEVMEAVKSQFHFLALTIREGELNQVRLPSFGRFYTTTHRVNKLIDTGKVLDRRRIDKDIHNHLDFIMGREDKKDE